VAQRLVHRLQQLGLDVVVTDPLPKFSRDRAMAEGCAHLVFRRAMRAGSQPGAL